MFYSTGKTTHTSGFQISSCILGTHWILSWGCSETHNSFLVLAPLTATNQINCNFVPHNLNYRPSIQQNCLYTNTNFKCCYPQSLKIQIHQQPHLPKHKNDLCILDNPPSFKIFCFHENTVKPQYSVTLIKHPWKSVKRKSLYSISIYHHPQYTATDCSEQTISIFGATSLLRVLAIISRNLQCGEHTTALSCGLTVTIFTLATSVYHFMCACLTF